MNPKNQLPPELLTFWQSKTENCTIVHCTFVSFEPVRLRVWKKRTMLKENTGQVRRLIKPIDIDITLYKSFKPVNNCCNFTLVFEGLSPHCTSFHLFEEPPAVNCFYSDIISRNNTDAYRVVVKRHGS